MPSGGRSSARSSSPSSARVRARAPSATPFRSRSLIATVIGRVANRFAELGRGGHLGVTDAGEGREDPIPARGPAKRAPGRPPAGDPDRDPGALDRRRLELRLADPVVATIEAVV